MCAFIFWKSFLLIFTVIKHCGKGSTALLKIEIVEKENIWLC